METNTLTDVLTHPGPYATVLVEVSQDSEHGQHERETRVRDAVQQLVEQGAPPTVAEAVRERLDEVVRRPAPVARMVVAAADGIVYDDVAVTRVEQPVASWQPLPDLASWVAHRDASLSFVVALVDHEGGEISLWDSDVPEAELQVEAGGQELGYVHKAKTGDWADINFQHSTENVWRHNADAVAEEVTKLVRSHGHPLVLVGGDPQSVAMLRKDLDGLPSEVIELPTGQRTADGGEAALQQAIREVLAAHVAARRTDLVHRLRDALGRGEGAATGVHDVAEAFVQGRVATLLVDPAEAAALELEPSGYPGLSWGAASVAGPVRADEALIAAAIATDAEVSILPSAVLGGAPVAALLRWT